MIVDALIPSLALGVLNDPSSPVSQRLTASCGAEGAKRQLLPRRCQRVLDHLAQAFRFPLLIFRFLSVHKKAGCAFQSE